MRILAGGGGAAIASHATNVLLNTTRMEALGLAAGMSYARNWTGRVKWYIDNKGVIENFWRMPSCVANDWCKMGDRDIFGYINHMEGVVLGRWNVKHQEGHVERRKLNSSEWTNEEWGNVEADRVCGRTRKMALSDELKWSEQVDEWRAKSRELEEKYDIPPVRLVEKIKLPPREYAVPKVEPWELPTNMQWELCWDNQVVVGKVADWIRETLQNTISNEYLASQTAGLFRPGAKVTQECESVCEVGDVFDLDGEFWEVKKVDGDVVLYGVFGEDDGEDNWEVGESKDISKLVGMNMDSAAKEAEVEYSPDPDVRLVRNVWTKGNVAERVKNVKFMWGIFACNELLFKRFGMGDSAKCDVCNGIESPWHVIGECPGKRAVEIRTDWADRMWRLVQEETMDSKAPLALDVANALRRMWKVEDGGALQTWQPDTDGNIHGCSNIDNRLKGLIENVTQAGSWAVWMGVFSRGWMEMLIAGGMTYHSARRLTGRISKVIMECRCEIAKERNERARSARVEKQKEDREELIKAVRGLWDEDRRSVTEGYKRPLAHYLSSRRNMLTYKNSRERAADTARKRKDVARRMDELRERRVQYERKRSRDSELRSADRERRSEELRKSSNAHRSRQDRIGEGVLLSRQRSLRESFKRKRVIISDSDDEGEHASACLAPTLATASAPVASVAVQNNGRHDGYVSITLGAATAAAGADAGAGAAVGAVAGAAACAAAAVVDVAAGAVAGAAVAGAAVAAVAAAATAAAAPHTPHTGWLGQMGARMAGSARKASVKKQKEKKKRKKTAEHGSSKKQQTKLNAGRKRTRCAEGVGIDDNERARDDGGGNETEAKRPREETTLGGGGKEGVIT